MSWQCQRCNSFTADGQKHDCIYDERDAAIAERDNLREKVRELSGDLATWEADLRAEITRLSERCGELTEALESARGWVASYAMQTYSRVASKELDEIDELLAKYGAKGEGCFIAIFTDGHRSDTVESLLRKIVEAGQGVERVSYIENWEGETVMKLIDRARKLLQE